MADNVNIIVQDTINDIVVNAAVIVETIDINVQVAVDEVQIIANPNNYVVNINRIIGEQVQSDWTQTDNQAPDYIKNKPTIPAAQVNSDWDATSGVAEILNKPTIPAAVTKTSDLINDGENGVDPFITAADIPPVTGFVPYTGATQDVDLGEFEIKAGQVEFDQTPTGTSGVGIMQWNDSDGTVNLGLKGGNVTLQIGQEQVLRVVNKTATNVNLLEANYQAVRVTGAQGQRLKVDLAQATNDTLSAETIGLVTETINNNQEGFITTSGLVRGINTTGSLQGETWADGDILYLSPTTAGRATKVKPVAPNHLIILGYVIHAHITQGSIFVKVDNGYELDELHNVKITSAANNNVLAYTSATDIWENKTVATALGYTPFELPALTSGSVLFSNGTTIAQDNAQLFWDDTNNRLGIGTATPATTFQVLGTSTTQNIAAQTNATYDIGLLATRFRDGWFSRNLNCGTIWSNNLAIATTNLTLYNAAVSVIGTLFGSGNLLLSTGTQTDAGYKLDVNGTARVSGIIYLTLGARIGTTTTTAGIFPSGTSGRESLNLRSSLLPTDTGNDVVITNGQGDVGNTSSIRSLLTVARSFAPTSGTGVYNLIQVNPTINQTGGANGITRGLYINPTLTAAADFRAIEVANGVTVLAASVAARASLRIPSGTAPTTPTNGDIWFDGTDLKMRIGGVTKTFTLL